MTKVNTKNVNETKSDILSCDIFKSDTIFTTKLLKDFNDFHNWHLSISLQK